MCTLLWFLRALKILLRIVYDLLCGFQACIFFGGGRDKEVLLRRGGSSTNPSLGYWSSSSSSRCSEGVEHRGFGSIAAGLSSSQGGILTAEVDANFCRRGESFSSREFSFCC
jgi:hypothetical protein